MYEYLFYWLLNLVNVFSQFGAWLTTPILYDFTPLSIISVGGIGIIVTLCVAHLLSPLG